MYPRRPRRVASDSGRVALLRDRGGGGSGRLTRNTRRFWHVSSTPTDTNKSSITIWLCLLFRNGQCRSRLRRKENSHNGPLNTNIRFAILLNIRRLEHFRDCLGNVITQDIRNQDIHACLRFLFKLCPFTQVTKLWCMRYRQLCRSIRPPIVGLQINRSVLGNLGIERHGMYDATSEGRVEQILGQELILLRHVGLDKISKAFAIFASFPLICPKCQTGKKAHERRNANKRRRALVIRVDGANLIQSFVTVFLYFLPVPLSLATGIFHCSFSFFFRIIFTYWSPFRYGKNGEPCHPSVGTFERQLARHPIHEVPFIV